jgi:hypothetical protein
MSIYSEESVLIRQIKSWRNFADSKLDTEKDRKEFKDMLNGYYKYAMVLINSQCESFPSKPLIMTLLLFQYRRIMKRLMDKA